MDLNEHNEVAVALALGSLRLAIPILEWSMLIICCCCCCMVSRQLSTWSKTISSCDGVASLRPSFSLDGKDDVIEITPWALCDDIGATVDVD